MSPDHSADKLKTILEKSVNELASQQSRSAVLLLSYDKSYGIMEYLSIGDMQGLHLRGTGYKKNEIQHQDESSTSGSFGKFKSLFKRSKESKVSRDGEALNTVSEISQTYFDTVHSDFVGKNSLNTYQVGGFPIKKGDYIVCVNRGVADSLFPSEIVEIVEQFHALPKLDLSIDLDIMAGVITQKAFNKIVNFDENRPLVKKLKTFMCNPQQVSVDECFAVVIKAE